MGHIFLEGLLLPDAFNQQGEHISISLCTRGESSYQVVDATTEQDMDNYLRQPVRIGGELNIVDGKPQILVSTIELLTH